jgi:adenine-specific DNA-methyltransferase
VPELHWLGDTDAKRATKRVPYRMLEPIEQVGDAKAQNLLIQGDNLDALKALLPLYAGRVKCIYADPPFNTKQAFPDYDDNLEHSQWLSMAYPLLELQRDLLAQDGTIFIHIDDNELGYLIAIADEIFGRKNRIAVVTFKQGSATGHKSINPGMVNTTNFVLVYAKEKNKWKPNRIYTGRERDPRYGQFIENHSAHFSQWKLIPLSKAIERAFGKGIRALKQELASGFEECINEFVIANCERVVQPVRPDYDAVGEAARKVIDESQADHSQVFLLERPDYSNMYFHGGQRWIFYRDKLKEIDGQLVAGEPLTNLWSDLLSNNLHNEGDVEFPKSKKPEALVKRLLEMTTSVGELVLDCFLGSGTTSAVAHKMKRTYIGIERGDHAQTKCLPRMRGVVNGEQGGISEAVGWKGGGGFRFMKLGEPVFLDDGSISPAVRFATLASYLWFLESGTPHATNTFNTPLLGVVGGNSGWDAGGEGTSSPRTAIILLYNGILGDKRPQAGNVLTTPIWNGILAQLPPHIGPRIIYGEACRLSAQRMKQLGVTFKQIPYDIRMR